MQQNIICKQYDHRTWQAIGKRSRVSYLANLCINLPDCWDAARSKGDIGQCRK